jgi:hypothetical protein
MVTIQKILEIIMGDRGSNLKLYISFVKEQRVNGNYLSFFKDLQLKYKSNTKLDKLRCTLMGYENNYQIKIPANQLNNLSTLNKDSISP